MFIRHMLMSPDDGSSAGALGEANLEILQNGDVNESFDDMDYESEASKKAGAEFNSKFKERIERAKKAKELEGDEDEKPKAKKKEEKKEEEPAPKKKSDIDTLKDSEEIEMSEKDKKSDKKKEKEKELDAEEETTEDGKGEEKGDPKKLKIRMSDGLYGIESDAKVRVKIDGSFQEVPVQELINNYSGKTAWDKKFTEIGQEKKTLESRSHEVEKARTFIKSTADEIIAKLDDPNGSPFDALNFLVEKSGRDPYTVWKRSLEANLDEVEKLMGMSEIERRAYFLEKKDEFRTKSEKARMDEYHKVEASNKAIQKVDSLRQAHDVSEDQYLQAWDELEAEGEKNPTDERIVDYASMKPHISIVQDILEPFQDNIDDAKYSEVVQSLARQLRAKDYTPAELTEWAKKEFMDEDLKDLTARTSIAKKIAPKETVKSPEKFESFADFDE